MTWLLFYSSFKQLINELHTSDMAPPCPIISSIYFYSTKHCCFVTCLHSQIGSGGSHFNSQNNATVVPHRWHRVIVNHRVGSHKAHHKSPVISCNKRALFYRVKQLSLNVPCNLMSSRRISSFRMRCGMRVWWTHRTRESPVLLKMTLLCFVKSRNLRWQVAIFQIDWSSFVFQCLLCSPTFFPLVISAFGLLTCRYPQSGCSICTSM